MLSKVITISQQKGGTGKTTLAVHLAMGFVKYHNYKVAVVDTDPQGSLGKWFMIRSEKKIPNDNLTDILRNDLQTFVFSLTLLFPIFNFFLFYDVITRKFLFKNYYEDLHLFLLIVFLSLFFYFLVIPDEGFANVLFGINLCLPLCLFKNWCV